MSVRILLAVLYVLVFSVLALRGRWYVSLCAALVLMAVIEHPDMPKSLGGIQGMNLWNLLMLNVIIGWLAWRRREGLVWDMPRGVAVPLGLYFLAMLISFSRLWFDRRYLDPDEFTSSYLISEYLINCYKWVIPALLLYDGCRSRQRVKLALAAILCIYFLLALQVIRWVPLRYATAGSDLNHIAAKILQNEVGYHRVNLSMMLSGACWAVLACLQLFSRNHHKLLIVLVAAAIAVGQALTGGRMGYVTWGAVGLILCTLRWRKLLPLIPVGLILIITFLPAVKERMLQGFSSKKAVATEKIDDYEMTSGRTLIWPYVLKKIDQNPVTGYGRLAMNRTGLATFLLDNFGEDFPHPHNAYLEVMLDNGLIGTLMILPFFLLALFESIKLLGERRDLLVSSVGGVSSALMLALLIAAMGSQSFYPREGAVGMWAAIGVMLRVSMEYGRSRMSGTPLFSSATGSPRAARPTEEECWPGHEEAQF